MIRALKVSTFEEYCAAMGNPVGRVITARHVVREEEGDTRLHNVHYAFNQTNATEIVAEDIRKAILRAPAPRQRKTIDLLDLFDRRGRYLGLLKVDFARSRTGDEDPRCVFYYKATSNRT